MSDMKTMIAAVRRHARANYNMGGWDYVVECYSDADIEEEIGDATTIEEAIIRVGETVGIILEHEQDAQAEAW